MNTRFFQVPTPESGHGRVPEYKVKTLYSGTYVGTGSLCARVFPWFQGTFTHNPLLYIPITPCYSPLANMAFDGAKWTKEEITALIDAYSDAETSANPMTTNRDLYRSIADLLKQNNEVDRTLHKTDRDQNEETEDWLQQAEGQNEGIRG